MKRKALKAPEPDLFSVPGAGVVMPVTQAPPRPQVVKPPPPAPPSCSARECQFDGNDYRITKHEDEAGPYCKMFVRDAGKWRRLYLLGGDAKYIPDMLIYHAAEMIPQSAGRIDRQNKMVALLNPKRREEPDEPDGSEVW